MVRVAVPHGLRLGLRRSRRQRSYRSFPPPTQSGSSKHYSSKSNKSWRASCEYKTQRDGFGCGPIACINSLVANGVGRPPSIRALSSLVARKEFDYGSRLDGFDGHDISHLLNTLYTGVKSAVSDAKEMRRYCDAGAVLIILYSEWMPATPQDREQNPLATFRTKNTRRRGKPGEEIVQGHYVMVYRDLETLQYVVVNDFDQASGAYAERWPYAQWRQLQRRRLVKNPSDRWGSYPNAWVIPPNSIRPTEELPPSLVVGR